MPPGAEAAPKGPRSHVELTRQESIPLPSASPPTAFSSRRWVLEQLHKALLWGKQRVKLTTQGEWKKHIELPSNTSVIINTPKVAPGERHDSKENNCWKPRSTVTNIKVRSPSEG